MPKYLLFLVALLWTVIVAYFCLIKSSDIPVINIPNLDKCIHVFFHFVFTFVWFLFFRKQIQTDNFQNPLLYSFILSFVFGITIEILQELVTTTRSADIFDVLANLTGALVTVFTVFICNKLNILNSIFKD
ncbi:VanZ family protein [Flavobacterium sp. NAS39]|uniref:VanZ family protein n=1 Tax=Flavobacterium taihuense TaxID=2857508 RepID=A0ABS6XSC2_9FLAO|nr:VanZ family protein [Flavobacterium taihuense]